VVGVPSIAAALAVWHYLRPPPARAFSAAGAARFLIAFFRLSIASGVEVALCTLHPRMPLKPGVIGHRLRLESPADRIMAAGTVSLLPGSLSAALDEDELTVHVLDRDGPVVQELENIERLVAGLHRAGRGSFRTGEKDGHG
jgi:multicomponent Na+:H+ antiporter subunit E